MQTRTKIGAIVLAAAGLTAAGGSAAFAGTTDATPTPAPITSQPVAPSVVAPSQVPSNLRLPPPQLNPLRGCRVTQTNQLTFVPQLNRWNIQAEPSITCINVRTGQVQVYVLSR